jgi:hypothetical protein
MPFTNEIKNLFSYSKLYSVFLCHFWFWRRRFLKEMLFWHILALTQATCVQKIKFVGVVVFEKKRFEAIVDGNVYA